MRAGSIGHVHDMGPVAGWALFLDVDGTLLELAPTPEGVVVAAGLPALLARVLRGLGGSLALVSGRSIAMLDRLFAPYRFPAAGIHGVERRDAAGRWHFEGLAPAAFEPARTMLRAATERYSGLRLEDKGRSLALHFRQAPAHSQVAHEAARRALALLPPEAHLQAGDCVIEIKSAAATKGTAVAQFMREPPFAGRVPVMIGDDVTDEDGFGYVEARGGHAIEVGSTLAKRRAAESRRRHLASPAEVRAWLSGIAADLQQHAERQT